MGKWADYLISEVKYGKNHLIEQVKIHTEDENGIGQGTLVDRSQITHNIKNGKSYKTIVHGLKGWKLGDTVQVNRVDGDSYIRIDKNKTEKDFLGPILDLN